MRSAIGHHDDMPSDRNTRRALMDWGECIRLLDRLQWATQHDDLLPRVRALANYLAASVGWPGGVAPSDQEFILPKWKRARDPFRIRRRPKRKK